MATGGYVITQEAGINQLPELKSLLACVKVNNLCYQYTITLFGKSRT